MDLKKKELKINQNRWLIRPYSLIKSKVGNVQVNPQHMSLSTKTYYSIITKNRKNNNISYSTNKSDNCRQQQQFARAMNRTLASKWKKLNEEVDKLKTNNQSKIWSSVHSNLPNLIKNQDQTNQKAFEKMIQSLLKQFIFKFKLIPQPLCKLIVLHSKGELFEKGESISKEELNNRVGFVMIGKILLNKNEEQSLFLHSGNTIHQQIFLERKTLNWSAKIVSPTFILWLTIENWLQIRLKAFLLHDLKNDFHVMQNCLRREYIKKWYK